MLKNNIKHRRSRQNRQVVRYAIKGIRGVQGISGIPGIPTEGGGGRPQNAVYDDKGNEYVYDQKRGDYIFWQPVGGREAVPKFYKDYLASKKQKNFQTAYEDDDSDEREGDEEALKVPGYAKSPEEAAREVLQDAVAAEKSSQFAPNRRNMSDGEAAAREIFSDLAQRAIERRDAKKKRSTLELMRSDDFQIARDMRDPSIINHERLKDADELNESFDKRSRLEYTDGYVEARSHKEARSFLYKQFHIETGADFNKLPLSVANHFACELVRFRNVFGTVGFIDRVVVDSDLLPNDADAGYEPNTRTLLLRSDYREPPTRLDRPNVNKNGFPIAYLFSTGSSRHVYRHEIAHALYHFIVQRIDSDAAARATELHRLFFSDPEDGVPRGLAWLSKYAQRSEREMFAEAVASIMDNGGQSLFARAIVNYVMDGRNNMITHNKAVLKMLDIPHRTVIVGEYFYHVIPEHEFTQKDIEDLREDDATNYRFYKRHIYANFLPDDVRPADVKKL